MKKYEIGQLRNIAVVGHNGSGKTSLGDYILFKTGVNSRIGKVDDGNSMLDIYQYEIDHNISIASKLYQVEYNKHKLNFLDTPGFADFTGDVKGAVSVVESVLFMIDSQSGIEVGTEKAWEYVSDTTKAKAFFINKMDKEHADFEKVLDMLKESYGEAGVREIAPIVIPMGNGFKFKGLINILTGKAYEVKDGNVNEIEIPADYKDKLDEYKEPLLDAVAESDDELMDKYLEEGELTTEEILRGLKAGVATGKIVPVFCGTANNGVGVDLLLDMIVELFPSPDIIGEIKGKNTKGEEIIIKSSPEASFSGLVYKVVNEHHMGDVVYMRIYGGSINTGDEVLNTIRDNKEKIGQMYHIAGKNKIETNAAGAGDFVALVKLKNTKTNDTLCDKNNPVIINPIIFPNPVMNVAIKSKNKGDEDKIGTGLSRLNEEDPSFKVEVNAEIRQTLIYGMGELHLDYIVNKLKNRFKAEVELEKPRIPYRETIQTSANCHKKYKKQTGGRGQYGEVYMELSPLPRGGGFEFVDNIVGGVIPGKFIPAVEKGLREALQKGVLAGYPVVDVKVRLYDGSFHPVDSSELAFKLAASMAFQEGMKAAKPILLEPIYKIEVKVPEEFMGDVMGDLNSRRGRISGMDQVKTFQVIKAEVPLAELYKYSTVLRSLTQGRGLYTREFSHYNVVPHDVAEKVIEETAKMREEESSK